MGVNYNTRHSGIFNASGISVTVIGLGGIGSFALLALAKMGCHIHQICDMDVVSEENVGTQLYGPGNIGGYKVAAIESIVAQMSGSWPDTRLYLPVDENTEFDPVNVVVSALDSITARQKVWAALKKADWDWYLESRMRAEEFYLFSISKKDTDWYDVYINGMNEEDVPDDPCTSKATIYTANFAAGHIALMVSRIIRNKPIPHMFYHNILEGVILKS